MKVSLKLSIAVLTLSIFAIQTIAQQADSIRLVVQYKTTHIIDTTQPKDSKFEMTYVLFIGDRLSLSTKMESIQTVARVKEMPKSPISTGKMLTENFGAPFQFIRNFSQNSMISHTLLVGTCYEVEEPIPVINWTISTETKIIKNYTCQKATTFFRGRNYEAWFCIDLPFSIGPWKFGGLPGLILEAYDDKKEIVFTLNQISKTFTFNPYPSVNGGAPFKTLPDQTFYTILPLYADYPQKKTEKSDLLKIVKLYQQDPNEFTKKVMNNPNLRTMGDRGGSNGQPIRFNNHLEKEGYN